MKILVIGGGAAGLAAACEAGARGADVTILEEKHTVGEKLSRTGNGHGNIGNADMDISHYNPEGRSFVREVFHVVPPEEVLSFLRRCGIETRTVDGRIYPLNEEAPAVTALLRDKALRYDTAIHTNAGVRSLAKSGERFIARTDGWTYEADRVILATGTPAGSKENTGGGDGMSIARSLGHSAVPFRPALCPLRTEVLRGAAGVRVRACLALLADGEEVLRDCGQIQLTDYGISGIPAMNLSGAAGGLLAAGKETAVRIDFLPGLSAEKVRDILAERDSAGMRGREILRGILPEKLIPAVLGDGRCPAERLKGLILPVYGLAGAASAQVMRGGIPTDEIDPLTMGSRKCRGVYLCGEMLNVDGQCGGYNLAFAFAGGILAGRQAAHA